MKQFVIFILLSFSLCSCKMMLINVMMKDPNVETKSTICSFLKENSFSTENTHIMRGDTAHILDCLITGMTKGYYIYDQKGRQLCYKGNISCTGFQFKNFLYQGLDSFELCKEDPEILDKTIASIIPIDCASSKSSELPKSDFYVIVYWQKFIGGKKGYKNAVIWMENEAKKVQDKKITFIKVNADMQEEWGLEAGKKAKLRWRKKGGHVSINITNIPKS